MAAAVSLRRISPFQPDALELIGQLNAHNLSLYTEEFCHLDPPEILARENCVMIGAYRGEILVGIGAVKFFPGYGEIKRMFVIPEARGLGIAELILEELLALLREKDLRLARIETGYQHIAAMGLYRKKGFAERGAFGDYPDNGVSVFLERPLP